MNWYALFSISFCFFVIAFLIVVLYSIKICGKHSINKVTKNVNLDNGIDFVCLGDIYINTKFIQSIYLDDNGRMINIKTPTHQYDYRFVTDDDYNDYLNYIYSKVGLNIKEHNLW